MKIGFFISDVGVPVGSENNVSAHVQIPLHSMKLLRDAGHLVQLITTEIARDEVLPHCMPSGIAIYEVPDARRRHKGQSRVRPLTLIAELRRIREILKRERYDVVHFHGSWKLTDLAVLVGLPGVTTTFLATINDADLPTHFWSARRQLWKRIAVLVTSTEFVRDQLIAHGMRAEVVKHGAVRDLKAELAAPVTSKPHRVLFWRDPSITNGADICLAAFRELAPKFPHISFDAAVRNNHWADWTPKLQALAAQHPNINVHVFPYTDGTSLAQLLAESICILLPFRELSYHPQLSVLESIQFGTTVITSALASNVELADAGRNALLVPVADLEATIASIEKVLKNPGWAQPFARQAAERARAVWNWDNYVPDIIRLYTAAIARTHGQVAYPDLSVH